MERATWPLRCEWSWTDRESKLKKNYASEGDGTGYAPHLHNNPGSGLLRRQVMTSQITLKASQPQGLQLIERLCVCGPKSIQVLPPRVRV